MSCQAEHPKYPGLRCALELHPGHDHYAMGYTWPETAQVRTRAMMTLWWGVGEATHGERGLACVSEPWSLEGIGALHPDAVYAGSPASFVRYLRHLGYTQLDVDDEAPLAAEIRSEWSCASSQ
jgi:hypothetical protein